MAAEQIDARVMELMSNENPVTATMDRRIMNAWNHDSFAAKVKDIIGQEITNHMNVMHQRMDRLQTQEDKGRNIFSDKRAEKLIPPPYYGRADKSTTFELLIELTKNWGAAIYGNGLDILQAMEDLKTDQDHIEIQIQDQNLKEFSGRLYEMLLSIAKGEVITFVRNPERDGLKSWRSLLKQYDPREQVDETVAYEKISRPSPVKSIAEARIKLPQWLNDMGLYTAKWGNQALTEPARLLALKTLVPRNLLGNKFVGNKYTDHKQYVSDLEDYIGDRSIQEIRGRQSEPTIPMEIDAVLAGMTSEEGWTDDAKNEIMSVIRKHQGKGKAKGSGKSEQPWASQGKSSDNQWAAPWQGWQQGDWNNKGSGKGKADGNQSRKAQPGSAKGAPKGGKGGGKADTRKCFGCGQTGHIARNCPNGYGKSIYGMGNEEEYPQAGEGEEEHESLEEEDQQGDANTLCALGSFMEEPKNPVRRIIVRESKSVTEVHNKYETLSENDQEWPSVATSMTVPVVTTPVVPQQQSIKRKIPAKTRVWKRMPLHTIAEDPEENDANSINCLEDYDDAVNQMICEVSEGNGQKKDRWEKIEAAVDSAAVDCVISPKILTHIRSRPSARSKAGRHYVAANDHEIKNFGERRVPFATDEGINKTIMFQDADVGRTLISVDKLNAAGCDVILNRKNPRIVTPVGETLRLKRKGGVFVLTMWVKLPPDGVRAPAPGKKAAAASDKMEVDGLFRRQA